MFIWMLDPEIWLTLVTLTFLEIILGVDNIIFLSLVVAKLPPHQQNVARKLFTIAHFVISVRTIILFVGGCFLIYKSLQEIRGELQLEEELHSGGQRQLSLAGAVVQIMLLDIVFSLDSVITAVGLSQHIFIMITAVIIAVGIMMFAAKTIGDFVNNTPTMKMLALTFLLLVGILLVADSLEIHIAKGYLYFAIFFSLAVETLNIIRNKKIIKASDSEEAYDSLPLNK